MFLAGKGHPLLGEGIRATLEQTIGETALTRIFRETERTIQIPGIATGRHSEPLEVTNKAMYDMMRLYAMMVYLDDTLPDGILSSMNKTWIQGRQEIHDLRENFLDFANYTQGVPKWNDKPAIARDIVPRLARFSMPNKGYPYLKSVNVLSDSDPYLDRTPINDRTSLFDPDTYDPENNKYGFETEPGRQIISPIMMASCRVLKSRIDYLSLEGYLEDKDFREDDMIDILQTLLICAGKPTRQVTLNGLIQDFAPSKEGEPPGRVLCRWGHEPALLTELFIDEVKYRTVIARRGLPARNGMTDSAYRRGLGDFAFACLRAQYGTGEAKAHKMWAGVKNIFGETEKIFR